MNAAIKNKLAKIEARLIAPLPPKFCLLSEPGQQEGEGALSQFKAQLESAKAGGKVALVVRHRANDFKASRAREVINNVVYVDHPWEADLFMLARLPSSKGAVSALDDVLNSLVGNVFEVVADVAHLNDA